ncbi:MAG: GtrA family protein [Bacteroidia bacterium]|nr:GtrA family protein [Bacteroidia bacterium]
MSDLFSLTVFYKFIKFGIVGFTGLLVDFAFTYLFRNILKVNQYIANAVGFIIAATTNYILNRIWTFKSNNPDVLIEFGEFFLISLIGLGINSIFLWILVSKLKRKFYFSKLIAIVITTFWNFAANLFLTFN